jgi:parvulin-like peptidyl-prolyl isomerase
MISKLQSQRCQAGFCAILFALVAGRLAAAFAGELPARPEAPAVFATDTNAGANIDQAVPGAAAVVDDHVIPMDDVIVLCLQQERSYVIDQMLQSYVLDRECEKRGITVSEEEIDKRVAELRASLAPATLDDTLKRHHMSMAELRHVFRQSIEKPKLVEDQIRPVKMRHCRQIAIRYGADMEAASGTNRTESQALAVIKEIQAQLRQGKSFEELAAEFAKSAPADGKSDLGVLYENMLGVEAPVLTAAMALGKGEISEPVETKSAYCLVQAVSTGGDHPTSEAGLYGEADKASRHLQTMFLGPKTVVGLIDKAHITFVKDEDIIAGKPLPPAAAVIDGHAIPMSEVVEKCLAENGPKTVDILVQNYVVDRECERRGITVSEAEIDARVDKLRQQLAPHTMEEALTLHHATMAGLRYDFRQEIERTKLVMEQVKPTRMVHARTIFVKIDSSNRAMETQADADARTAVANIEAQLRAGKSFENLAQEYSAPGDKSAGDLGILYEDMRGMDTAILNTALAMSAGDVSTVPGKTRDGYFLLKIISTSGQHDPGEDAAYRAAVTSYREAKAQMLVPKAIVGLIKKSRVVYYVHS